MQPDMLCTHIFFSKEIKKNNIKLLYKIIIKPV